MINFGRIESDVRTLYEAESPTRLLSSDFMEVANEGLDELSEFTGFFERVAVVPLKGKRTYYDLRGIVPDDAVRINDVYNPQQHIWLDMLDVRDMKRPRWETVPGDPQQMIPRGLFWLGVFPRPEADGGYLHVYYSGMAPHFKDQYSIVPDFPDEFIPVLEDYMLYALSGDDKESGRAMAHWKSFDEGRRKFKAWVDARITADRAGRM